MGHSQAVKDVAFNNNGTRFLTCSYDRQMKLWDTETGKSSSTIFFLSFHFRIACPWQVTKSFLTLSTCLRLDRSMLEGVLKRQEASRYYFPSGRRQAAHLLGRYAGQEDHPGSFLPSSRCSRTRLRLRRANLSLILLSLSTVFLLPVRHQLRPDHTRIRPASRPC
jgi:hypothetical protein